MVRINIFITCNSCKDIELTQEKKHLNLYHNDHISPEKATRHCILLCFSIRSYLYLYEVISMKTIDKRVRHKELGFGRNQSIFVSLQCKVFCKRNIENSAVN